MSEAATVEDKPPQSLGELRSQIAREYPDYRTDGQHPVETSEKAFMHWMKREVKWNNGGRIKNLIGRMSRPFIRTDSRKLNK